MGSETKHQTGTESALIERSRQGDLEAFDSLVQIHQDRIYNLSLRLLGNEEDALDLAQEAFCAAFRKMGSFRGEAAFFSWLYRITVNLAKNFWRKGAQRVSDRSVPLEPANSENEREYAPPIPNGAPNPRQQAAGHELRAILDEKMNELSFDFRTILALRFMEGLSYEEIAEALGCNMGTVKSRLNRARNELRDLMEPYL